MFVFLTKFKEMKKLLATIIGFMIGSLTLLAQEFQGQAIYQSKTVIDIKLDSSKMSSDMQKNFKEMLKRQFEKTFELNFNKIASIYKEQVKLEQPGAQSRMRFMGAGRRDIYYKDTKQKTYTNQNELFGKVFLIKDSLPNLEWKLEKESKLIGNYLCFKATAEKKAPESERGFRGGPRNKNKDEKPKDSLPKTISVTAWYTPQIPVNQGPGDFWGLPGLILEINYEKTILLCTKIVLNPKEKETIALPDKGKVVSQTEYDDIVSKKMKEMQEQYGGKKRGKGNVISIEINH